MVKGIKFRLPYVDVKEVNLTVEYDSLQGSKIPSYTREDLSNAVTTLARGFEGNSEWGPALATLVGVTSDAFKSYGMERHVFRGLNMNSGRDHVPDDRLIRVNKSWGKISKRIRTGNFNYVLNYKNAKGENMEEAVTNFSAGTIFALINFKDGSKEEKSSRKLATKGHGKRKRDGNDEKGSGGSKKSMGAKNKSKRRRNFPQTRKGSGGVAAAEDESEFLKETEHNKHPSTLADGPEEKKIEVLQQTSNEFVKEKEEQESEPKNLDEWLERRHRLYPPFDYSKAPKPFPVRMVHREHYYVSSDSDSSDESDSSDSESDSDSHTKVIAQEDSGIQKFDFSKIEAKNLDECLEMRHKLYPPFDYSKAPKPFPVRMVHREHYYVSDSDDSSDSESDSAFSDSDSEASVEEESKLQKENSPEDTTKEVKFQPNTTPEEGKTHTEPKEALDFDQAKSSTANLMSGPNAPASSILF